MTAKNWEFTPSIITVNNGDTVKLHIKSVDITHGFKLSAFGINEDLEPGQTVDVEFVADKAGTFTFVCSVFCGPGHSKMDGQLIVK
jgi:nitrosocyanin